MFKSIKEVRTMSLDLMRARMNAIGGSTNDGRINNGKLMSLRSAMKNSYQAEWITYKDKVWRCLINPEKLSTDYDQKEISIEFESEVKPGCVFLWNRTNTHWMVLNQRLTEEAYFRGEIRQCDYEIATDKNRYWIWLRGPIETTTNWKVKHDIVYNDLNYTLLFYVEKNEDTDEFFTRHKKIKFDGHNWTVVATDRYSQEGIIEVYLKEANDNKMEDAKIIPEIEPIPEETSGIKGEQIVHPYDTDVTYTIKDLSGGRWAVSAPKKVKITNSDDSSCTVDIITGRSGEFTLQYIIDEEVAAELMIIIESL